jgi:hypothetical protein
LIELFSLGRNNFSVKQISISIDDIPLHWDERESIHIEMQAQFNDFLRLSRSRRETEIHITACDINTLSKYGELNNYFENFEVVSLSNISDQDIENLKKYFINEHINYNHLCPDIVNSYTIREQIEHIIEVAEVVDTIYIIVRKRPTGKEFTPEEEASNISRLQQDLSYIRTILAKVPESVRRKINIDTCIEDVIRGRRTGSGCSANVSKFQVWPDGTVSGCPYAFSGCGKIAKSAEDILRNIELAKSNYEYETCYLRRSYNTLCGG